MARRKDVLIVLDAPEYAALERWANNEDRHVFAQARYLLVGLLRRHVEEALATAELAPSTAAD